MIRLDDYSFILRHGSREEVISYASIVAVRIDRSIDHTYKLYLYPDGHETIVINSQSIGPGITDDNGREYAMFVRVLHHHLKEKSQAVFTSGGNFSRIWQWAVAVAAISLVISLGAEYGGFSLMNAYAQALILTTLTIVMLFAFRVNKLPKSYSPTNIPLQYLP